MSDFFPGRCAACDKVGLDSTEVFCSKECYREHADQLVFIGHMMCFDYDYTIVTKTKAEAEKKLLAEWKRQVIQAGTQHDFTEHDTGDPIPIQDIDFVWLNEWNGSRVEATILGKINRP